MSKVISRSALIALGTAALLLGGCAEVNLLSYGAKKLSAKSSGLPTGETTQASLRGVDRGVPKLGNPYQVNGIWYYPKYDPNYNETGIASWYGEPFHGRKTANGATYNMYEMTAAHKTLPLPTDVRVTNLENGRSVIVTVNDRGPFVNSRIIDLSYRAAQLLGMVEKGTAKVRVEVINSGRDEFENMTIAAKPVTPESESRNVAAVPQATVQAATLAPPSDVKVAAATPPQALPQPLPAPGPAFQPASATANSTTATAGGQPVVTMQPVGSSEIFIQAGAFIDYNNAHILSARLSSFGPTKVSQVLVNGQDFYRVRVGPVGDINEADRLLSSLIDTGHRDARIIIE